MQNILITLMCYLTKNNICVSCSLADARAHAHANDDGLCTTNK